MKKFAIICAMFSLLSVSAGSSWASPIFFDDFNSENSGVGVSDYDGFANWTVSDGTVDLIGTPPWDLQPSYGLYVDMDGSTSDAGRITSAPINLDPGEYILSFDIAGNLRGQGLDTILAQVGGGSLLNLTVVAPDNVPFMPVSWTFNVPSAMAASISFEGVGGDNVGLLLDNVSLSIIPAPGSILLVGVGVGFVGWLRRRGTL